MKAFFSVDSRFASLISHHITEVTNRENDKKNIAHFFVVCDVLVN